MAAMLVRLLFALSPLLCCCRTNAAAIHSQSAASSSSSSAAVKPTNNGEAIDSSSSSSTTTSTSSSWSTSLLESSSKNQDPYVAASPLSVAAVCRDGIALISLHYNVDSLEVGDDTTLTLSSFENDELDQILNETEKSKNNTTSLIENGNSNNEQQLSPLSHHVLFRDLPLSSRGPLRIEPIHEASHHPNSNGASYSSQPPPMSLLTAGWRTDGMALCDAARELMSEEVRLYCLPSLALMEDEQVEVEPPRSILDNEGGDDDGGDDDAGIDDGQERGLSLVEEDDDGKNKKANVMVVVKRDGALDGSFLALQQEQQSYYGQRIAEGVSYYLAKCTFSEGVRSLSCVGLLACGATGRRERQRRLSTVSNTAEEDVNDNKHVIHTHQVGMGVGSLYLIDATGTHRVRAHAIGNGSSALHRRMVFVDFERMDCQEGLRVLLRLIAEEGGLLAVPTANPVGDTILEDGERKKKLLQGGQSSGSTSIMKKAAFLRRTQSRQQPMKEEEQQSSSSSQQHHKWNIPSNTAVELAVLKSGEGRMRRIRLPSLF